VRKRIPGIAPGLWFYPWAGYEKELGDALRDLCDEADIRFLSNDAELGYKWKGRPHAKQRGTNMRGMQPEAIQGIAPARTKAHVEASARILVRTVNKLVSDYSMDWGHWFTSYGVAKFHRNFPWRTFAKPARVLSPQLYIATPETVDEAIRDWYLKADDKWQDKIMIPSIGTYGPQSGRKMHEHLCSFVDSDEGVDGFTAWSWKQTNAYEWSVLRRWAAWIKRGATTLPDAA